MPATARLIVFGALLVHAAAACAQEAPFDVAEPTVSVFAFGGRFANEDMLNSAAILGIDYEDNALYGAGVQTFVYESRFIDDLSLGFEAGFATRIASEDTGEDSGEFWSGIVARYDGLTLFGAVDVSPAFTLGLSAVTGILPGREAILESLDEDSDASLVFYLAPEINLSLAGHDEAEVFYRLHHRSGGWGTLGDIEGASNANVFGLRMHF